MIHIGVALFPICSHSRLSWNPNSKTLALSPASQDNGDLFLVPDFSQSHIAYVVFCVFHRGPKCVSNWTSSNVRGSINPVFVSRLLQVETESVWQEETRSL